MNKRFILLLSLFTFINFFTSTAVAVILGVLNHWGMILLSASLFSLFSFPFIFFFVIIPFSKIAKKAVEANSELSAITSAASDAIIMMNERGNITFWNKAASIIFGFQESEALGKYLHTLITPERLRPRFEVAFAKLKQDGWGHDHSNKTFEMIGMDSDGREFPIEISLATIMVRSEWISIGIIRDISIRKKLENENKNLLKEKDLILREVHHRIKNNMSIVISLLSLQAFATSNKSESEALEGACNRIHSMMILYDRLYRSGNYSDMSLVEYLDPVMEEFVLQFNVNGTLRVEKDIDDSIVLDVKTTQTIGIILNELLSNIIKYAYDNNENKLVTLVAKKSDNSIFISLKDNGKGIPETIDFTNSTGFGFTLVSSLVKQLNGTISIINREKGTTIVLKFPYQI